MTHSDDLEKLSELCRKLAESDAIAQRPELPQVFQALGRVIERQQHDLDSLKAELGKRERPRSSIAAGVIDTERHAFEHGEDAECPPRRRT